MKRWTLVLAVTAVSLLGACGATDTASKPAASSSASAGVRSFESFGEFQLAFAGCMREHGVNMPDPSGGGMQFDKSVDPAAFESASTACREQLGTPPVREGGRDEKKDVELLADHLKIAKCLREHGVEVPDPTADSPLAMPETTPEGVMTTCAPNGVVGRAVGK